MTPEQTAALDWARQMAGDSLVWAEHVRVLEGMARPWQPIDSAPKDGTEFLGYRQGKIANAYRVGRDDCEMWVFGSVCGSTKHAPYVKPTHWMPLPALPAEQEKT